MIYSKAYSIYLRGTIVFRVSVVGYGVWGGGGGWGCRVSACRDARLQGLVGFSGAGACS